jgi:ABC-type phosphate transport system substrate-binding protein
MRLANLQSATVVVTLGLWLSAAVHGVAPPRDAGPVDVVVVVSPQNPVTRLTRNQVADLFLGRAVQFSDGRRAVPVDQSEGSTVREAFSSMILQRTSAQIRAHWAKIIFTGRGRPPLDLPGSHEVKGVVAQNPQAIGYIDRSLVDDSVVVVTLE